MQSLFGYCHFRAASRIPPVPVPSHVATVRTVKGDLLAGVRQLAGVADAVAQARAAADEAYRHPALRRSGGKVAAEVGLRAAVASAALASSDYDVEQVRAGTVTDPVVQGALRCGEAIPGLVDTWLRAPGQVLARLHVLAARGTVPDDALGRPDPAASARLAALAQLVTGGAEPGLVRAAVVHGELLALRCFAGPYGVVARAAARLDLAAGGFDPRGVLPVELGHRAREPEYVGAANTFATGTPDGVRAWLRHCATAVRHAAGEFPGLVTQVVGQ